LTEEQLQKIHHSALDILEKIGVKYRDEETQRIFRNVGATVDERHRLVKIPSQVVEETIRKAPNSFKLESRDRNHPLEIRRGRMYARPSTGFSKVIDLESGISRNGMCRDTADISKLIDDLENISINATHVFPSDVPQEFKDVYSFKIALENSEKHVVTSPLVRINLELMYRIASVYQDETSLEGPIFSALICPISPLTLRDDVSIFCAKKRIPAIVNSAPIVGVASPVTLAGTLVMQCVESLATIALIQLVSPGSPIILGNKSTPMEMRSGTPLSGTVEIGMLSAAAVQVAHFYDLPSEGFGTRTDSKTLDEQTGVERIFTGLLPALAGATIDSGAGAVEIVATFSSEQLVIDEEVYGMIFRLLRGIDFDEETLALKEISKVGPEGSFLGEEHTRKNYLKEFYQHRLFDKRSRKEWEAAGHKDIRQAARDRVKRMLAEHQPVPELSKDAKNAIERVIREAAHSTM